MEFIISNWKSDVVGIGRKPRWWQSFEKSFICEHITLHQDKLGLSDEDMIAAKKKINESEKDDLQDAVNELYAERAVRTALIKFLSARNRTELGKRDEHNKYKMIGVASGTKKIFDQQKKDLGYGGVGQSEFVVDLLAARSAMQLVMDNNGISFDDAIAHLSELYDV